MQDNVKLEEAQEEAMGQEIYNRDAEQAFRDLRAAVMFLDDLGFGHDEIHERVCCILGHECELESTEPERPALPSLSN
jgi:hypothetical protein